MDALKKIKEAKELLDMGAISEDEFNQIKNKYFKKINGSDENVKPSTNSDMAEKASTQAANTAAREVTKEIMRGIFGQNRPDSDYNHNQYSIQNNNALDHIFESGINTQQTPTVVRQKSTQPTKVKIKNKSDKPVLDEKLQKRIEDDMDEVCRIFSIPNLGKKFVINKLASEYTEEEISNKLKNYTNQPKQSQVLKRVEYKKKFLKNNIEPIPEIHFELYFLLNNLSFKSKKKFMEHMQTYWDPHDLNNFYDEYNELLKEGIQKKDFEKIMGQDIKETCEMFSISYSMRRLGNKYIINKILNNYSEHEIKEKLNARFKLSDEYLNKDSVKDCIVPRYEPEEPKVDLSTQPDYYRYKVQTNALTSKYEKKEQNVRSLIEKCFPGPQITNSKFNGMVDECSNIFVHKSESIMVIIESTNEYSDKLENEIKSGLDILNKINNKLDSLHEELLIIQSETDNEDIDFLLDEMDTLINSVKDYKID